MIKITKINWLSKEAKEAEVFLSDGKYSIVAFGQPFEGKPGDVVKPPFYALEAREIYAQNREYSYSAIRVGSAFTHNLAGKVIDKTLNMIKVGSFTIELDNQLPNDIQNGDFITCVCSRIDI